MFTLIWRGISITSAYLYPLYSSYKSIKTNDAVKLERWLQYWCVIGVVSVGELTVEWLVNWLPFYYECKMFLLLWLALPQIQGSSWVYLTYIHPFFLEHENDIDNAISEAKLKARAAGLEYLRRLWTTARESFLGEVAAADIQSTQPEAPAHQQVITHQAWTLAGQLIKTYGGTVNAVLHPMQGKSPTTSMHVSQPEILTPVISAPLTTLNSHSTYSSSLRTASVMSTRNEIRQRRAELEQELARLSYASTDESRSPSPPTPAKVSRIPSTPYLPSASLAASMASSLIGGQYEQITTEEYSPAIDSASIHKAVEQASSPPKNGWFWWQSSPPLKQSGHVKSD